MLVDNRVVLGRQKRQIHKEKHQGAGQAPPFHKLIKEEGQSGEEQTQHEEPVHQGNPSQTAEYFHKRPSGQRREEPGGRRPAVNPSLLGSRGEAQAESFIQKSPKENETHNHPKQRRYDFLFIHALII